MPSSNISVVPAPAAPPVDDAIPADVVAVVDLFAGPLAKVSFPDIDAASLKRQADELRSEARTVAKAREALEAAEASFAVRRAKLREIAARAVAYARIYSESHSERADLAAALAALAGAKPAAASEPAVTGKRRGRPPKRSAELFDAPPAEAADDAAAG